MVHLSKGWRTPTKQGSESSPIQKLSKGRLLFFGARFCFVFGFLLLCFCAFPASLFSAFPFLPFLLCFSAFLLVCLCAFLFSAFLLFPLLLFLLFCFCAFLLPLFLFFSHVFLLLYFLLLCFSASFLYCLFVFIFLCFILSCLYPKFNPKETLDETQRRPKEILIRNPTWNPK